MCFNKKPNPHLFHKSLELNGMRFIVEPVAFPLVFDYENGGKLSKGTLSEDEYLLGDIQSFTGGDSNLVVFHNEKELLNSRSKISFNSDFRILENLFFKDLRNLLPFSPTNSILYFSGLKLRLISDLENVNSFDTPFDALEQWKKEYYFYSFLFPESLPPITPPSTPDGTDSPVYGGNNPPPPQRPRGIQGV